MAAIFDFVRGAVRASVPSRNATPAAATLAQIRRAVSDVLDRQHGRRPQLVRQWEQTADGRLACFWSVDLPAAPAVVS